MTSREKLAMPIGAPQERWMHVGPYYAMFPLGHVSKVIKEHTQPGDAVLDPFAGRFSVPALASYMDRKGCGLEISPLGWLYGKVKLNPARRQVDVLRRLDDMASVSGAYRDQAAAAGEFFRMCYCPRVLQFLFACRHELDWKKSIVDATLMAMVMISLHHNVGRGLSNQMRQAKALAPKYSVNWWKSNGMETPPEIDPVAFMRDRLTWRYGKGTFSSEGSQAFFGDSCDLLKSEAKGWAGKQGGVKLLFTSPPYWSVVNYFKDQWLRLWMLGGEPKQAVIGHSHKKGFDAKAEYRQLMSTVFSKSAGLMRDDGVVVVRADASDYTINTISEVLEECFPNHRPSSKVSLMKKGGQTALFNNLSPRSSRKGERDIILTPA